jgi:hypothetical protein
VSGWQGAEEMNKRLQDSTRLMVSNRIRIVNAPIRIVNDPNSVLSSVATVRL